MHNCGIILDCVALLYCCSGQTHLSVIIVTFLKPIEIGERVSFNELYLPRI